VRSLLLLLPFASDVILALLPALQEETHMDNNPNAELKHSAACRKPWWNLPDCHGALTE
jgi:hypothetical protein